MGGTLFIAIKCYGYSLISIDDPIFVSSAFKLDSMQGRLQTLPSLASESLQKSLSAAAPKAKGALFIPGIQPTPITFVVTH